MERASRKLRPLRICLIYALAGSLWIGASDFIVDQIPHHPLLPLVKGWMFVAVTGLLLYVVLYRVKRSLIAAEHAQELIEDRFRKVVENAPEGIFVQVEGKFRYVNPAGIRCLGAASADDLIGRSVLERIHHDSREQQVAKLRMLNERRESVPPEEQKFVRLDNRVVDVEVRAVPIEYIGEPAGLIFFSDITERKRAESERLLLEEQVRHAQKMESIGRLAGGVAHDFNNYLTVINGYTELLLATLKESDPARVPLEQIRKAGDRASGLTRQLLAFTRKEQADLGPVDIGATLRDIEKMLRRLLGEDIELSTWMAPDTGLARCDEGWIGQIVMNLAVNARDAMPQGGKLRISTYQRRIDEAEALLERGARPGSFVVLEVADTGVGMNAETQQMIFEPFYTTKKAGEGTGLGLTTVYNIISRCGGWVTVDSAPGAGTTFRVHLMSDERRVRDGAAGQSTAFRGNGGTLLLAEDQEDVRMFLRDGLTSLGYVVLPAKNGTEALTIAANHPGPIDLLITDVVMPDINGREVADLLKQSRPETKVIFVSGYTAEVFSESMPANAHYLSKPISMDVLALKVAEVIGSSPG